MAKNKDSVVINNTIAPEPKKSSMSLIRRHPLKTAAGVLALGGVLATIGVLSTPGKKGAAGGGDQQQPTGPIPMLDSVLPPLIPGLANSWLLVALAVGGVGLKLAAARRR